MSTWRHGGRPAGPWVSQRKVWVTSPAKGTARWPFELPDYLSHQIGELPLVELKRMGPLNAKSPPSLWQLNDNCHIVRTQSYPRHTYQILAERSLLATCRLHDIDPYDYFVDVLQRVGQHPASKVDELTPRRWKQLFAAHPLRSDLYGVGR